MGLYLCQVSFWMSLYIWLLPFFDLSTVFLPVASLVLYQDIFSLDLPLPRYLAVNVLGLCHDLPHHRSQLFAPMLFYFLFSAMFLPSKLVLLSF